MNRDEILKMAQSEKDERELLEDIKAQKLGGSISITIASFISLALVVDGYLLESYRTYDFVTVALMFIAISILNSWITALYRLIKLQDKKEIGTIIGLGIVIIGAVVMVVKSFF